MGKGGARVGAGRKAGSKNRPTISLDKINKISSLSPETSPLAFLLAVMQDEKQDHRDRVQCAIAAAPYVHARLASVEVKGDAVQPLRVESELGKALQVLADLARQREKPTITLLASEMSEA